jgi:hypothetical protein
MFLPAREPECWVFLSFVDSLDADGCSSHYCDQIDDAARSIAKMVFSSGLEHGSARPPKQRAQAPAADETTPLLPGRRTSAVLAPSSSGASSLTISSIDDSDEFVPWYADVERNAATKAAAAASIREVAPTTAPVPPPKTPEEEEAAARRRMVLRVVAILVVGMLMYNADGSLVLATHPTIASEFNDLADSSWLFTAFALAGAATQAIVGLVVLDGEGMADASSMRS